MFKGKRFSLKGNIGLTFLSCLAVSALIIIFLSLIFAIVANKLEDPTGNLGIFSFAVLIRGAAAGGFISAKMKKEGERKSQAFLAAHSEIPRGKEATQAKEK